jgi:hypothetical protein
LAESFIERTNAHLENVNGAQEALSRRAYAAEHSATRLLPSKKGRRALMQPAFMLS